MISLSELRRILMLLVAAGAFALPSAALADDAAIVSRFVDWLLDPASDSEPPAMTAEMNAAMSRERASTITTSLVAQNGTIEDVGRPWHEGRLQGYERYRVPIRFTRSTLDLRVTLSAGHLVAGVFVIPHAPPPDPDVAPPVREIDVSVGELPGTLSIPDGRGPFPAVVLVHGSGPNDRDETIGLNKPFRDIAWGLASRGIAVLRYDKRTFAAPRSLADLASALTVVEEVINDAVVAVGVLSARDEVDPDGIFVLGHSLGGTVAPRIARAEPRVSGLVILAGAAEPLHRAMQRQVRYIANLDGKMDDTERKQWEEICDAANLIDDVLGGRATDPGSYVLGAPIAYYRDMQANSPLVVAPEIAVPMLLLWGARDYQVVEDDFLAWRHALGSRSDVCFREYAELDHLFRHGQGPSSPADYERVAPVSEDVIDDVASWIRRGSCP